MAISFEIQLGELRKILEMEGQKLNKSNLKKLVNKKIAADTELNVYFLQSIDFENTGIALHEDRVEITLENEQGTSLILFEAALTRVKKIFFPSHRSQAEGLS